jgi:hypothetical protein
MPIATGMSVRASMATQANRTLSRSARQQGNAVRNRVFSLVLLLVKLIRRRPRNVAAGAAGPERRALATWTRSDEYERLHGSQVANP